MAAGSAKGGMAAHAQRQRGFSNSTKGKGKGPGGRPAAIDDPLVRETMLEYAAMGVPHTHISRALGLHPHYVTDILNRGEAAAMAEDWDDKYAQFYHELHAASVDQEFGALGKLYNAADPRMVERWLARTTEDMSYVDRDRLASRPDINIHIGSGSRPDALAALSRAKGQLQEPKYVDSSARTPEEPEGEPARLPSSPPGYEPRTIFVGAEDDGV